MPHSARAGFNRLLRLELTPMRQRSRIDDVPGVYLLFDRGAAVYVGTTRRGVRTRLNEHVRPSSGERQAHCAFNMARLATGNIERTYKPAGSRKDLMTQPDFQMALAEAKEHMLQMDVAYIEERDKGRRLLLENRVLTDLEPLYNTIGES